MRDRDVPLVQLHLGRSAKNVPLAGFGVELDHGRGLRRRGCGEDDTRPVTPERRGRVARERKVEARELSALEIENLEPVDRGSREDAGNPTVAEEGVAREIEDPLRVAELRLLAGERMDFAVALHVEIRPAGAIGDEVEKSVRAPFRLEDRLLLRARDATAVRHRAVAGQRADTQIGAFEWHVRVIPGQPGQSGSVRARPWSGVEVAAACDHLWFGGAVGREDDELVLRFPFSVGLPDADDEPAIREDAAVRIAEGVRLGWLGRDRLRVGAGCFDSVEAAVVEARAEHHAAVPEPGPAAVFVNTSPHVEIGRDDIDPPLAR